jgi:tRNA(Ile)-lysidine synthase
LARPLLAISKARLIATAVAAGIAFADDPSNRDPRHTRPRLRTLMPKLETEGLTASRLALLARRLQRAEAALRKSVADAQSRVSLTPWGEGRRIVFDRVGFARLPDEIAIRLLGQAVAQVGDEGPVELGKLESLFDSLSSHPPGGAYRRSLAGALVNGLPAELVVERAPARRGIAGNGSKGRISALTTRKSPALDRPRSR